MRKIKSPSVLWLVMVLIMICVMAPVTAGAAEKSTGRPKITLNSSDPFEFSTVKDKQELLDEAEGDAEPLSDVLAGGVVFVAGGQDAGAQIEGEGFHGAGFYHVPARKSTLFLENRARPGRRPFPASVRRLKRLHII